MGTWCSDSRESTSLDFYKIMDKLSYLTDEITLIAVNQDKKTEGNEIDSLDIEFVPHLHFLSRWF